jgi:hypothetical protein
MTCDQTAINLDEVVEIRTRHREHIAIMKDGSKVYVHDDPADVVGRSGQLIPAIPGYELLVAYEDDGDKVFVDRQPILAWRDSGFSEAPLDPVAIEGTASNMFCSAIRMPDGRMINPGNASWESEEAWRAELPDKLREVRTWHNRAAKIASGQTRHENTGRPAWAEFAMKNGNGHGS